jgi:hypothetical protein
MFWVLIEWLPFCRNSQRKEQKRIDRGEGGVSADDASSESNLETEGSVNSSYDDEEGREEEEEGHGRRKRQRREEPVYADGVEGREMDKTVRRSIELQSLKENGRSDRKYEKERWDGEVGADNCSRVSSKPNGWRESVVGVGPRPSVVDDGRERSHWNRHPGPVTKPLQHPAHLADLDSHSGR